jgi:LPXTG-motif cell wall-anchored protein
MLDKLMQLQLPHWLIVAGLILVTIGSLGVLFGRRKDSSSAETAGDEAPER